MKPKERIKHRHLTKGENLFSFRKKEKIMAVKL